MRAHRSSPQIDVLSWTFIICWPRGEQPFSSPSVIRRTPDSRDALQETGALRPLFGAHKRGDLSESAAPRVLEAEQLDTAPRAKPSSASNRGWRAVSAGPSDRSLRPAPSMRTKKSAYSSIQKTFKFFINVWFFPNSKSESIVAGREGPAGRRAAAAGEVRDPPPSALHRFRGTPDQEPSRTSEAAPRGRTGRCSRAD